MAAADLHSQEEDARVRCVYVCMNVGVGVGVSPRRRIAAFVGLTLKLRSIWCCVKISVYLAYIGNDRRTKLVNPKLITTRLFKKNM